jgi:GDP/UDP-N,N'-diacetylbacillosamine 2-epimerase (hydrolysing)
MQGIKDDPELVLQVIATGMHLSPTFGLTHKVIEEDGFKIDAKVEILGSSDSPIAIAESMAQALTGGAEVFSELRPDLVVVLGDRFEIFAVTAAALLAKIPIAHLHGGETTLGAYDEAFRHSITKMSHFHFVAADDYRSRVIQLGEDPKNVFMVGGLGIDSIEHLPLLSRKELEVQLGIEFAPKSLLITFHPATLDDDSPSQQMRELLSALSQLQDTTLIFTMPNADTGGRVLIKMIEEFVSLNDNSRAFTSLGQLKYFSCIAQVDGVVGNSSSGLTEVPSFRKGTVNIGDRQTGRLQAGSIINCSPTRDGIQRAIAQLYSTEFERALLFTQNPYGDGGASDRIVKILREAPLGGIMQKYFHDI